MTRIRRGRADHPWDSHLADLFVWPDGRLVLSMPDTLGPKRVEELVEVLRNFQLNDERPGRLLFTGTRVTFIEGGVSIEVISDDPPGVEA